MESAGPTVAQPPGRTLTPQKTLALVAAAGLSLVALSAYASIPLVPCPFRAMTHLPCPGCGLTRSLTALFHGNLVLSFRYHPLGLPVFVAGFACLALPFIPSRRDLPILGSRRAQQIAAIAALVLLLSVWAVRMVFIFSGSGFFLW